MNQKQGAGKNKHHQLLLVFILTIVLIFFIGFNIDWKLFASSMSWKPSENNTLYWILLSVCANIGTLLILYYVIDRKYEQRLDKKTEIVPIEKGEKVYNTSNQNKNNECLILGNKYQDFNKTLDFPSTGQQTLTIMCEICKDIDNLINSGVRQDGKSLYDFKNSWENKLHKLKNERPHVFQYIYPFISHIPKSGMFNAPFNALRRIIISFLSTVSLHRMLIAEKVGHHIFNKLQNKSTSTGFCIYFIGFSEVVLRIISTININKQKFKEVLFVPITIKGYPVEIDQIKSSLTSLGLQNSIRPPVTSIAELKKSDKELGDRTKILVFGCERATTDNRFIVMRGVGDILSECGKLNIEPILTFEEYKIMDYDFFDKIKNIVTVPIEEIKKENFNFHIITGLYHTTQNLTRMATTKNLGESYRAWVRQIGSESYYVAKANYMSSFLKEKVTAYISKTFFEGKITNKDINMLELGIGSCEVSIGIVQKISEIYNKNIYGTGVDINPWAIDVAEQNILSFALKDQITILEGNYFDPINKDKRFDLIIGNLPQMPAPESEGLESERWVSIANDGGPDGCSEIYKMANKCYDYLVADGQAIIVIFEFLYTEKLKQFFSDNRIRLLDPVDDDFWVVNIDPNSLVIKRMSHIQRIYPEFKFSVMGEKKAYKDFMKNDVVEDQYIDKLSHRIMIVRGQKFQ